MNFFKFRFNGFISYNSKKYFSDYLQYSDNIFALSSGSNKAGVAVIK